MLGGDGHGDHHGEMGDLIKGIIGEVVILVTGLIGTLVLIKVLKEKQDFAVKSKFIISVLIAFGAGCLFGDAIMHLVPHSL